MGLIREWIITIISVIIFVTFVEILVPNSNHKRYINVVVGFLLMIIILNPLTKLISGEINFEEAILRNANQIEISTARNMINNIEYSNKETVMKLYKDQISKQLRNRIEENTDYMVENVEVQVEEDANSPNFGMIDGFNITLIEDRKAKEVISTQIKPVQINISLGKNNDNTVEANSILISNECEVIRDDISKFYNVSRENISISILKSN